MSALGLNRKLVRAIYPAIDWDEYDREVVAESEVAAALERVLTYLSVGGTRDVSAPTEAGRALARVRGKA